VVISYQGDFLAALVGSNAIAFTSGSSANADSIRGLIDDPVFTAVTVQLK
jgi:hypothetical protein